MTNSNTRTLKQEQSPVGGDCYHTIYLNCKTNFFFMVIVGAMAIAPYGFFNVKIVKKKEKIEIQHIHE